MDELDLELDNEYDLNEIESRLYSQVFHGTADDEIGSNIESSCDTQLLETNKKQRFRYFGSSVHSDNRSAVKISIDNSNQIPVNPVCQSNVTILTPSHTNSIEQSKDAFQNITVNQYTIPVIIHTDNFKNSGNVGTTQKYSNLVDIENFTFCEDGNQLLTKKQRTQIRNRRKRERQRLKKLCKNSQLQNSKYIIISDDSGDDCTQMKNDLEKENIKINVSVDKSSKEYMEQSDEDDIIYIPPPPIEVINIEEDTESTPKLQNVERNGDQNNSNCSVLKECSESASNDFLEHPNTENASANFNFSLHGSDFNNSSEFARPSTPVDFCETESSCSTNDQSKDFNNSAKAIVFDEVEFPREDIFCEKNLDSFSSFITPKRYSKATEETSRIPYPGDNVEDFSYIDESDNSKSSIESDYETSNNQTEKNLPTLSPMTSQTLTKTIHSPSSSLKQKATDISEEFQIPNVSKRKSGKINISEEQNGNKLIKKKKQPYMSDELLTESTKPITEIEQLDELEVEAETVNFVKKKKRKKSLTLRNIPNEEAELENMTCNDTTGELIIKKKRKRKKSRSSKSMCKNKALDDSYRIGTNENVSLAIEDVEETATSKPIDVDHYGSIQKEIEESQQAGLDEILDPNDVDFSIGPDHPLLNEVNDDEVIVVENKIQEPVVIVVDDKSDSDVEIIETDLDDSSISLQLSNCNTTVSRSHVLSNQISVDDTISIKSFDVHVVQSKQSNDPEKWIISQQDRSTYLETGKKGPRCNRCRHFGHIASKCPEKPYPPQCKLCGSPDHQEPRCPNKMCTQCGNPGQYSTSYCNKCFKFRHQKCNLCELPGHISKFCPDLWRRYHLTVDEGPIVIPSEQVIRPRNEQWCSGCSGHGHLEHECNDVHYHREYPPTRPDIVSYGDVLNEKNGRIEESRFAESAPRPFIQDNLPLYTIPNILNNLVALNSTNSMSQFSTTGTSNQLNSDIMFQLPNMVPNPCIIPNIQQNLLAPHLIEQIRANFQNNTTSVSLPDNNSRNLPSKFDMSKIQELFMSKSFRAIQSFLSEQLDELDTKIVNYNPKMLRHKLFKYDRFSEPVSEKIKKVRSFWFRILNMYIFGIHALNDGRLHSIYLRNFANCSKPHEFNESKRRSLYHSYAFIFGVTKHSNINYYRLIKLVIDRSCEGKSLKPL